MKLQEGSSAFGSDVVLQMAPRQDGVGGKPKEPTHSVAHSCQLIVSHVTDDIMWSWKPESLLTPSGAPSRLSAGLSSRAAASQVKAVQV